MKLKRSSIFLLAVVLFASAGCIHKIGGAPVTAWERVTADNAVFAQLNNNIEQGAEAVVTSGLLSPAKAAPVIAFTGQVATIHQQITAILAKGTAVSAADYVTIQDLLAQVGVSGTALIGDGSLGIKNPATQQMLSADVQALVNLASTLLTDVQTVQAAKGATN